MLGGAFPGGGLQQGEAWGGGPPPTAWTQSRLVQEESEEGRAGPPRLESGVMEEGAALGAS